MLVGFAALSPLGVAPAWVATAAALVLGGWSLARQRIDVVSLGRSTHAGFAVFVLCLGVVVAGVTSSFLGNLVADAVPDGTSLGALLTVALLATVLANVLNNLPATLLLVPLVAPLGVTAVLAALVGPRGRLEPDLRRLAGEPAVATHHAQARGRDLGAHLPHPLGPGHPARRGGGRRGALGLGAPRSLSFPLWTTGFSALVMSVAGG